MEKAETIILSRMYAGKYLEENIGHEVINLFRDDNGDNYIYVNEGGAINPKYNDTVKAVLLVRYVEKGVMEVIAKATGLKQVLYKSRDAATDNANQKKYVSSNSIRYGGVLLTEIYKTVAEQIVITFRAEDIRRPRLPLFLYEDIDNREVQKQGKTIYLPQKHFSSQSLKMYYSNASLSEDYRILAGIIADNDIWESCNATTKVIIENFEDKRSEKTFLSIIGKQYDELVFSNMLKFFFESNKKVFEGFADEVLGIKSFGTRYEIRREVSTKKHGRIDLWIENEKTIIVIENKIKAKINGVKEKRNFDDEKAYYSQLSDYYHYATQNAGGKTVYCYVFSPDYNALALEKYVDGNKYSIIKYSQIYEYYYMYAGNMLHTEYFTEFLDALAIHKDTIDNSNFETMKSRFISQIKAIREYQKELASANGDN